MIKETTKKITMEENNLVKEELCYSKNASGCGQDKSTYIELLKENGVLSKINIRINFKGRSRTIYSDMYFDELDKLFDENPLLGHDKIMNLIIYDEIRSVRVDFNKFYLIGESPKYALEIKLKISELLHNIISQEDYLPEFLTEIDKYTAYLEEIHEKTTGYWESLDNLKRCMELIEERKYSEAKQLIENINHYIQINI